MGLFTSKTKRTASVGIARENHLSGLVVAVHQESDPHEHNFSVSKPTKETDNKKNKPILSRRVGRRFKSKFFPSCMGKGKNSRPDYLVIEDPQHPTEEERSNGEESSELLSVYTSSYNHEEDAAGKSLVALQEVSNGCKHKTQSGSQEWVVTLDHLSDLILDLETAVIVNAKRPLRALKMLLALSALPPNKKNAMTTAFHKPNKTTKSTHETRIEMVRSENGRLIPVLLSFLNRCMVPSKEHSLTLLILGNLSIPQENKRMIAIEHSGAEILAKLLCENPSSHLLALVLVNLTYDSSTESSTCAIEVTMTENNQNRSTIHVIHSDRNGKHGVASGSRLSPNKELLATNPKTALVESLAFALRVSTLTQEEYETRRETIEDCNSGGEDLSPATRLSILMAKDQQLRSSVNEVSKHRRPKVLPATASPDQILKQLRSNEHELQQWGSIDGTVVDERRSHRDSRSGSRLGSRTMSNAPFIQNLHPPPMVESSKQMFPETAKWCLSALRNLTKPCHRDATAAHAMIKSGIFSLVVQCITTIGSTSSDSTGINTILNSGTIGAELAVARIGALELKEPPPPSSVEKTNIPPMSIAIKHQHQQLDNNFLSASYGKVTTAKTSYALSDTGAVVKGDVSTIPDVKQNQQGFTEPPLLVGPCTNSPYQWESNSLQDTALSIVLNLSATGSSREYMYEPHIVKVLTLIAEYPRVMGKSDSRKISRKQTETMNFQSLKARMALSYLIGSQGHFGQAKLRSSASTVQANRADSSLVMSDSNVELLIELLANAMNHRGKEGNGGGTYLSGAFDLKCVILSLRCLLTHTLNQEKMTRLLGVELNTLLMNALARFALETTTSSIDMESSGHIVFSLYLLSNHCFEGRTFLPAMYGTPTQQQRKSSAVQSAKDEDHGLVAGILVSYLRIKNIPPQGRHAAQQLLLRLKYLNFENCPAATAELSSRRETHSVVRSTDLKINYILLAKIKRVQIADRKHGSKPDPAIFRGRILRCQKPCNWKENHRSRNHQQQIEWGNPSIVSTFENALIAVQQLSYGSFKAHRSTSRPIDDIAIANKIAHCARHESAGCHNFLWAWEIAKLGEDCDDSSSLTYSNIDPFLEIESRQSCETFSLPGLCCSSHSIASEISEI